MRFIITAGTDDSHTKSEGEAPFDETLFTAYMKFNEDMAKAGVLIASEGLNPAGGRARVEASHGTRRLVDGPFAETKELLGGFYLIEVGSLEDAIEWAMRCPVGMASANVLNIQQLTDGSDIPEPFLELIRKVAPTWSKTFKVSK